MLKVFLSVMFLTTGVFAQQVDVRIDGQRYYCSQNPNNSSGTNCKNGLEIITQKYTNCYKTSSGDACIQLIAPDVKRYKNCPEVLDYCYNTCYKHSSGQYCMDQCYKN